MIYAYLIIIITLSVLNTVFTKKFQLGLTENIVQLSFYPFLVSLFAVINISIINGFKIRINTQTVIFALFYAIIVAISLISNMLALKRVELPVVNIVVTSGNIITTAIFGVLFLDDRLTVKLVSALILILTAVFIPYFKHHTSNGKNSVLICGILFLNSGAAVIILKLFTLNKHVTDTNSFFILTNIFLVVFTVILLVVLWFKNKENRKQILHPFNLKQIGFILLLSIISNFSSILAALAIAKLPISSYTIIISSLSLISSVILSKFYFKERVDKVIIVSVLFAIAATVVNSLE